MLNILLNKIVFFLYIAKDKYHTDI
jgi:hypothetical protein